MFGQKSIRGKAIATAISAVFALIGYGANAQSIPQPPTANVQDENGVNLATGKYVLPGMDVEIGTGSSGLKRVPLETGDTFWGTLDTEYVPDSGYSGANPNDGRFYLKVSYGGQISRYFVASRYSGVYSYPTGYEFAAEGGGRKLTCNVTGSAIISSAKTCQLHLEDSSSVNFVNGFMTGTTQTSGEVVSLTYYRDGSNQIKAVNTVNSSLGWALKYTVDANFKVTGVKAVNTSVTRCDDVACNAPASAPSVTASTSGIATVISRNGVAVARYVVTGANSTTVTLPSSTAVSFPAANTVARTYNTYASGDYIGRVSSVTLDSSTWQYSYAVDTVNNETVTTLTLPNGKTRKVGVDRLGRVRSVTDEAGRRTTSVYTSGYLDKVIEPDGDANTGGFTLFEYDGGRLSKQTVVPKGGASGGTPTPGLSLITTVTYYPCDADKLKYCKKPKTVTDPNGVVTTYTYHSGSGAIETVTSTAINGVAAQTRYTYAQIAPEAKVGSDTRAPQPLVWRLTRTSSCMSSNWTGSACAGGTVDEVVTITSYTGSYNLLPTQITRQRGDLSLTQTSVTTYNDNGWAIVKNGPKPGNDDEAYTVYDALGRIVGVVDSDPDLTGSLKRLGARIYFDSDGRQWKGETLSITSSARVGSDANYSGSDPAARQLAAASDLGLVSGQSAATLAYQFVNVTEYSSTTGLPILERAYTGNMTTQTAVKQRNYDNMLRVNCEAVRLNESVYNTISGVNACSLGAVAADGTKDRITQYLYHSSTGELVGTNSGLGTSKLRRDFTNVYDLNGPTSRGVLTEVIDANGNKTAYEYDDFNRHVRTKYPTAANGGTVNGSDYEELTYTGSWVTKVRLRNTQFIHFVYDSTGMLQSKSGAVSETFTYNNFGQVKTKTANGYTSTYAYNSLGWLLSETSTAVGGAVVGYGYDGYGRRARLTYPDGTYVTYVYNNADAVKRMCGNGVDAATCPTATSGVLADFAFDNLGQRLEITTTNQSKSSFTYDYGNDRLSGHGTGPTSAAFRNDTTFGYNKANQITSRQNTNANYDPPVPSASTASYAANGLNQVASISIGSTTTAFAYDAHGNMTTDGANNTYVYNANNLLTSATLGGETATLTYDAENRLYSISKSGVTTRFVYDGADLIAEYDQNGTMLRRYIHGPDLDQPLVWFEGPTLANTGRRFLNANELGSIVLVTDNAGAQLAINRYDAYGVPASGNLGRFQYTGQMYLSEIGLYYYKGRVYQPTTGRFLQTDPIGYGDGMNWYAYVHNDPINDTDPFGLSGLSGEGRTGNNADQQPQEDVVIRGDRNRGFFRKMWGALDTVAQYTVPGYDLARCAFVGGCSNTDIALGVVGLIPIPGLKAVTAGVKVGVKVARVAVRVRKSRQAEKALKTLANCGCFIAGTMVATPTGLVAIEDIEVGDLVLAYDEKASQTIAKPVTDLIRPKPKATFSLQLRSASGEVETFRATDDHPWFTTARTWVETKDLKAGDLIETATGQDFKLVSIKLSGKTEQTYNLAVADLHTFMIGENHVVVHNSDACDVVFRRGPHDSKELLAKQAAEAEGVLGIHGVSVSSSPAAKAGQVVRSGKVSDLQDAGMPIHKTGKSDSHYTVELPKPVTSDVANSWNNIFKGD